MTTLDLRGPEECRWDAVALGEVMLRLDPGPGRVRTTRSFAVWEGGGEYNVARALRKCFGLRTAVVTAFAENEIGHLIEDLQTAFECLAEPALFEFQRLADQVAGPYQLWKSLAHLTLQCRNQLPHHRLHGKNIL